MIQIAIKLASDNELMVVLYVLFGFFWFIVACGSITFYLAQGEFSREVVIKVFDDKRFLLRNVVAYFFSNFRLPVGIRITTSEGFFTGVYSGIPMMLVVLGLICGLLYDLINGFFGAMIPKTFWLALYLVTFWACIRYGKSVAAIAREYQANDHS